MNGKNHPESFGSQELGLVTDNTDDGLPGPVADTGDEINGGLEEPTINEEGATGDRTEGNIEDKYNQLLERLDEFEKLRNGLRFAIRSATGLLNELQSVDQKFVATNQTFLPPAYLAHLDRDSLQIAEIDGTKQLAVAELANSALPDSTGLPTRWPQRLLDALRAKLESFELVRAKDGTKLLIPFQQLHAGQISQRDLAESYRDDLALAEELVGQLEDARSYLDSLDSNTSNIVMQDSDTKMPNLRVEVGLVLSRLNEQTAKIEQKLDGYAAQIATHFFSQRTVLLDAFWHTGVSLSQYVQELDERVKRSRDDDF